MERWAGESKAIYVYFNNDIGGHAVTNAIELKHMLEGKTIQAA